MSTRNAACNKKVACFCEATHAVVYIGAPLLIQDNAGSWQCGATEKDVIARKKCSNKQTSLLRHYETTATEPSAEPEHLLAAKALEHVSLD